MTQSIIVGILALIAGLGVGTTITGGDEEVESVVRGQQRGEGYGQMMNEVLSDDFVSMRPGVTNLPSEEISSEEEAGLVYMREEEKLARDVYMTLYETWGTQVFSNIAQSEQTHTEAIRSLLEKYGIDDPVTDDSVGVFTNDDLATLYDELVEQGSESLEAALRVGALIEDLDINDLTEEMEVADNEDILLVYDNLQRGSRNHLRAFTKQLERLGDTYEPQYISQTEYESIVGSNQETGSGQSRGWGGSMSGRGANGGGMGGGQGMNR